MLGRTILVAIAGSSLLLGPSTLQAQMPGQIEVDPEAPLKEGFDLERALFWEERNFDPLRDPEWTSLRDARRAGHVSDGTPVLVFEVQGTTMSLVTSQMSYHHVAQGDMNGEPWMVTF